MSMKKLLFAALMAVAIPANSATLTGADGDEKESKNGITLSERDYDRWSMDVAVGVNVPIDVPEGYKFAPFNSWNIDFTVLQYNYRPKHAKQTYSIGAGFGWHNFGLKDNRTMFVKDANGVVGLGQFETNADNRNSRFHEVAFIMPLLFNQQLGKKTSISVGAQLNLNFFGRLNYSYTLDDTEYDISKKDIDYRVFNVDLMAIFHWNGIGIYGKYSPMSVFKKDRGPEFKSLSFGLYF